MAMMACASPLAVFPIPMRGNEMAGVMTDYYRNAVSDPHEG